MNNSLVPVKCRQIFLYENKCSIYFTFLAVAGAVATLCHDAAMNPIDGKTELVLSAWACLYVFHYVNLI